MEKEKMSKHKYNTKTRQHKQQQNDGGLKQRKGQHLAQNAEKKALQVYIQCDNG